MDAVHLVDISVGSAAKTITREHQADSLGEPTAEATGWTKIVRQDAVAHK